MKRRRNASRGFTLIEVLVALAVLAIAMGAVIRAVGANTNNAAYLREKTLAHWVAMNKVAEVQAMRNWPAAGNESGTEEMASHEWHWKVAIIDSGVDNVRRMEVEVRLNRDDEQPRAKLVALIGKPPQ